ncbi:hypothetical protein GOQ27_05795 [Clostridium sp. D2Q-11]|uniref:Uncharacterized protein n=1 Tax=Anaeromonas frigoriresistens TaxID=2683708 RepID=A0A942UW86_9FIRM|nr:hypothetical protein [Anaeromonas frigoriresistens]MBS4537964.1 hypothetical protein [Anaeromonas frigoriresistens]
MVILKDIFYLNKDTLKTTLDLLFKNWKIILMGFVYITINAILGIIINGLFIGVLRIIGGIILTLAMAAMTSNYLYLLQNIIRIERFTLQDVKDGFTALLRKVYGVLLIGWLASILYSMVLAPILGSIGSIIMMIVPVLVFVLLNPLPESIYLKYNDPWGTIVYAFEFIKENWLEWFVPNIVFLAALYFLSGRIILSLFMIRFSSTIDISVYSIFIYVIGQVVFSFVMIYRGVLFDSLSTSTRRKRIYMRDLYK